MGRESWGATVHGVTKSGTRLKRLGSSSRLFLDNKFFLKGHKSVGAGLGTEHIEDDRTRKEGNQVN